MLKQETIKKMMEAIGIKEQEFVLLHFWGDDADRDTLHQFEYEVARLGASSITIQQSREVNAEVFNRMKPNSISERYFECLKPVTTAIDICMYPAVVPSPTLTANGKKLYKNYMGQLFQTLTSKKKFVQIRIPTKANAKESCLNEEEFLDRMQKAYDIDYPKLKSSCLSKIEELKNQNHIVIRTGVSCELSFELNGREWLIDAGDGDFPCGEIAIAPIEEKTQGTIFFEKLYIEEKLFENVTLTVIDGKIVQTDNAILTEFLRELPENGNVVCELGFGMNPNVTELSGYTVLDEKMDGTFHIGLGMNHLFGGKNDAPIHLDLVHYKTFQLIFKK